MSKQKQLKREETNAAALFLASVMGKRSTAASSLISTLLQIKGEVKPSRGNGTNTQANPTA